jgi:drug/metabolite transporter (DMT)-like permease
LANSDALGVSAKTLIFEFMSGTQRATLAGLSAVLVWSFLSLLTVASGRVPPFQLTAMTFAIGGVLGASVWLVRGGATTALRQPVAVWALGITGLFGYHALYFIALRLAPPAEAQLVNYLWPLLIVLFAAFLPGERLRAHHIVGTLIGLAGTVLLFVDRGGISFARDYLPGFAAALCAALAWSTYSVLSRLFAAVPTDTVAGFCLATAALSAVGHLLFEETLWPQTALAWCAVIALGIGPVGAAFYAWDFGISTATSACSAPPPTPRRCFPRRFSCLPAMHGRALHSRSPRC